MTNTYVYRHIRTDTNEVFYIGIGNKPKFARAFDTIKRNEIWHRIYSKSNIVIEIIHECLTWGEACRIEIELIKKYGRINTGTGTLANMTDGGDGGIGEKMPDSAKERIRKAMTGRKLSKATIEKVTLANFKRYAHLGDVEVRFGGDIVGVYRSIKHIADALGFRHANVSAVVIGKRGSHKGYSFRRISKKEAV